MVSVVLLNFNSHERLSTELGKQILESDCSSFSTWQLKETPVQNQNPSRLKLTVYIKQSFPMNKWNVEKQPASKHLATSRQHPANSKQQLQDLAGNQEASKNIEVNKMDPCWILEQHQVAADSTSETSCRRPQHKQHVNQQICNTLSTKH